MNFSRPQFLEHQLVVEDWGLIDYRKATALQLAFVDRVAAGERPETLVFCSHPPILTLGRKTQSEDLQGWSGDLIEVSRGGRSTYHGPSQIIGYPILNLAKRGRDLHKFLRILETVLLETVQGLGVSGAAARTLQIESGESEAREATGIWVGQQKLAAIGIAVRKWVSYHGFALNYQRDERALSGFRPCGYAIGSVISLEELLPKLPERANVQKILAINLEEKLRAFKESNSETQSNLDYRFKTPAME